MHKCGIFENLDLGIKADVLKLIILLQVSHYLTVFLNTFF